MGTPPRIQPTVERNFRSSPLAPAALEVADDQAAAVLSEKTVVDAEIPVDDAEGVEAGQGVGDVQDPSLVGLEGGEAR